MLVIAMSIATATFKLAFVGITLAVALGALFLQVVTRGFGWNTTDGTIVVSLPVDGQPIDPAAVTAVLRRRLPKASLESVSQTDAETVVSYTFRGLADAALTGLQADLGAVSGGSTYNVFFNRPGAL
jgi:hypothetical protein